MTMPHERACAIRWGRENLMEIQADKRIGRAMKARAAEIFKAYPAESELQSWIDKTVVVLPEHSAEAMDEARRLFEAIDRAKGWKGTAELRRSLLYTLRHFPQEYEIRWRRGKGFGFDGWVGIDMLTIQVANS